jgi:hypothetical protein
MGKREWVVAMTSGAPSAPCSRVCPDEERLMMAGELNPSWRLSEDELLKQGSGGTPFEIRPGG